MSMIEVRDLRKLYVMGDEEVPALAGAFQLRGGGGQPSDTPGAML